MRAHLRSITRWRAQWPLVVTLVAAALGFRVLMAATLVLSPGPGSPFLFGQFVINKGMAVGDMDNDGDNDVVIVNNQAINQDSFVGVAKNNGAGQLSGLGPQVHAGFGASEVVLGHFNADNNLDAALDSRGSSFVRVLFGDGTGGFSGSTDVGVSFSTVDLAAGDLTNDGRPDLVVASLPQGHYRIFRTNGDGTFTETARVPALPMNQITSLQGVAVGLITNDANPDVVVGHGAGIAVYAGDGNGSVAFAQNINSTASARDVALGDLDGDGDLDAATVHLNTVVAYVNNAGLLSVASSIGTSDGTFEIQIADLSGDGRGEIVISRFNQNLSIFELRPAGLAHVGGSPFGFIATWFAIGEMNGTGPLDVVTGRTNGHVYVLLNNTSPDSTPPEVDDAPDITEEATGPGGAIVTYDLPVATDDVDGEVDVTCSPASGSEFALGTTEVECTATDAADNDGSSTFNVLVEDTNAPSVDDIDDMTAEAENAGGAVVTFDTPGATDAVTETLTVECLPPSGSTFGIEATTVTCTATDGAGNEGSSSFVVTVRDTTPPSVKAPDDITAELAGPGGAPVSFAAATASDAVGVTSGPTCTHASGGTFPLGTTTVMCTAGDAAGNSGSDAFNVTVVDTTAPELELPADVTTAQTACPGTPVTLAASASDSSGVATLMNDAPALYPLGTTTVTFTATDGSGNIASGVVKVTVIDQTSPAIGSAAPSQAMLWPPNGRMEPIDVSWSVSDCDAGPACKVRSVASNEPGTNDWTIVDDDTVQLRAKRLGGGRLYTITIECQDSAGNASQRTVTVTVPHDQGKE